MSAVHYQPLNALGARIMEQADRKGWNSKYTPEKALLNMHQEVSEAWDHLRDGRLPDAVFTDEDGKPDGVPIEMIDVIYRALHVLAYYRLNADELLEMKFKFNEGRSWDKRTA